VEAHKLYTFAEGAATMLASPAMTSNLVVPFSWLLAIGGKPSLPYFSCFRILTTFLLFHTIQYRAPLILTKAMIRF